MDKLLLTVRTLSHGDGRPRTQQETRIHPFLLGSYYPILKRDYYKGKEKDFFISPSSLRFDLLSLAPTKKLERRRIALHPPSPSISGYSFHLYPPSFHRTRPLT